MRRVQLAGMTAEAQTMDLTLLLLSLSLAGLLGFAAHRSSICTVLAVAEVLSTRRAYMLFSFVKTILWVLAITLPLIWLLPGARGSGPGWAISIFTLAGGFLFGVGAALNGGCAFSTLWKLGDGQLRMLLTLGSFCLGASGFVLLVKLSVIPPHEPVPIPFEPTEPWALALLAGLGVWVAWEARRLWRTRRPGSGWKALGRSEFYRLSTAAALLGLSNGILFALHGPWAYTNTLRRGVEGLLGADSGASALRWGLAAAVLAGVVLSAWQRSSFRLDWRPSISWAGNLAGGLLMGLGAGMAAGGNDVLLLHGIPGLSAHALPAYLALIAGIALVLVVDRLMRGTFMKVDCSGDVCAAGRKR